MVEFTMVAVPMIVVTMSIIEMSLESWKFHSMAYAIEMADRYACAHGRTCTKNSNACTITVGNVTTVITRLAPALDTSKLNVSLITHNGATTVTCNPVSTCLSSSTQFPNSSDNGVGADITIKATYPMGNPLVMMWFGSNGSAGPSFTLGATTRQTIVY